MTRIGIVGVLAALVVSLPGAALAQETDMRPTDQVDQQTDRVTDRPTDRLHRCQAIKERALAAIEVRLGQLDRLQTVVVNNSHITPEHQAKLTAELSRYEAGFESLARQIEAAGCDELPELIRRIVDEYRIFGLIVPKVHLVIGADTILDAVERAEGFYSKLQTYIERAEAAGFEVGAAQTAWEDGKAQLASVYDYAEPVPGMVLPLTPEDWPEAAEVLREARGMLQSAVGQMRAARASAQEVIEALREAISD